MPLETTAPARRCNIVHIDDNVPDSFLLQDAISHLAHVRVHFQHAASFREALPVLTEKASQGEIDVIILDWYLERQDGEEVLTILKTTEAFVAIPVLILTGSENPVIVQQAYRLHANCVLLKPSILEEYAGLAAKIEQFGMDAAQLPSCEKAASAAAAWS